MDKGVRIDIVSRILDLFDKVRPFDTLAVMLNRNESIMCDPTVKEQLQRIFHEVGECLDLWDGKLHERVKQEEEIL